MLFEQKMYAKVMFMKKLSELTENAFEDFFHNLMSARYPDYVDVRTHGKLGDMSADGVGLHSRKLYASYAPATHNVSAIEKKFFSDLEGAKSKRGGDFDTFVFVHNDMRGAHPEISRLLAKAAEEHAPLRFEHMGLRRLWQECLQLSLSQMEDLLGCEIPIRQTAYGIGLADLEPLLERLKQQAAMADPFAPLPKVSEQKLGYNQLSGDIREDLTKGMMYTHLVHEYYEGKMKVLERDEVAAGFSAYYRQARENWNDPEDIFFELQKYVIGNMLQPAKTHRAALVILAYFFERCDIFETPPPDWRISDLAGEVE